MYPDYDVEKKESGQLKRNNEGVYIAVQLVLLALNRGIPPTRLLVNVDSEAWSERGREFLAAVLLLQNIPISAFKDDDECLCALNFIDGGSAPEQPEQIQMSP